MSEEDAIRSPQGGEPTRAPTQAFSTPSSPSGDYPTQAYGAPTSTYPTPGQYGAGQGGQYGAGQPGQPGQYGGPAYPGWQYGGPGYPGGPGNPYPGTGNPNGAHGNYPAGYGQQPKQSKTGLIVGIGVGVIALIALVVGLIFFLNRDKASDDAQPDPGSVPSVSAPAAPDATAAPETGKAPILDSPATPAPAPSGNSDGAGNSGGSAGKNGKDGLTYTYPPEKIGALFDTFLKDPLFTAAFGQPDRADTGTCIGNAAQGKLSDQFIDVIERASKGNIAAANEIDDPKFMNDLLNFILVMDSCGVNITMQ